MTKWVELGKCTRPHGVKGGFSFDLYNLEESVIEGLDSVRITPLNEKSTVNPEGQEINITSLSLGNKAIAYLEGVNDRNQVEAMIPFLIWADRDLFPEPSDDEVYLTDLIGLKVIDHESGEEIGEVLRLDSNGHQDLVVMNIKNDGILELPFVPVFFPEIDVEQGIVKIIRPDFEE